MEFVKALVFGVTVALVVGPIALLAVAQGVTRGKPDASMALPS